MTPMPLMVPTNSSGGVLVLLLPRAAAAVAAAAMPPFMLAGWLADWATDGAVGWCVFGGWDGMWPSAVCQLDAGTHEDEALPRLPLGHDGIERFSIERSIDLESRTD